MSTQLSTQKTETARTRSGLLLTVALGAAALVALAAVGAGPAEANKSKGAAKIVFASDRTTGKGVDNPEGDYEIFIMSPNGKKPKQITRNAVDDIYAVLSPDGKKVAYFSSGVQPTNPQGDYEVYLVRRAVGLPGGRGRQAVRRRRAGRAGEGEKEASCK